METTASFEGHLQAAMGLAEDIGSQANADIAAVNQFTETHEEEMRRLESDDRRDEEARREFERWLQSPMFHGYRFDEHDATLAYLGDRVAEEMGLLPAEVLGAATVRAVIGRKRHHGVQYYRVIWSGRSLVTWEKDSDIEQRHLVEGFNAFMDEKGNAKRTSRLRPAVYLSRRVKAVVGDRRPAKEGEVITWSCEVQPFIWIPYDRAEQDRLEQCYLQHEKNCSFEIATCGVVTVDFQLMKQISRNGQVQRTVSRFVQLPPDVEAAKLARMTVDQIREYVATLPDILPHHYEALQRLHEADKVTVGASDAELNALLTITFEEIMNAIVDGKDFPGFTEECFVCLEDYQGPDVLVRLICGHMLHKHCAFSYFKKYSRLCPICKEDVL